MRFSKNILLKSAIVGIPLASATCPTPTKLEYNSWAISIAYAAQKAERDGTVVDAGTIASLFPQGISLGTQDYTGSSLKTLIDTPGACKDAVIKLVDDIKTRIRYQKGLPSGHVSGYACPTGEWDAESAEKWNAYKCQRLILQATQDFNTAFGNGLDIVTGEDESRLSVADYTSIEAQFMPFPQILAKAVVDVTASNSKQFNNDLTSLTTDERSFQDAMTLLPNPKSKECFSKLYDDMFDALNSDSALLDKCRTAFLQKEKACLDVFAVANNKFHNCIGGMIVHYKQHNDKCSDEDFNVYDGVFRAYGAISHCSDLTGDAYEECRMANSGLPMPADPDSCLNCWDKLAADLAGYNVPACKTDPFSETCLNAIDGEKLSISQLGDRAMASPLTEFYICTGRKINTGRTTCSHENVDILKADGHGLRLVSAAVENVISNNKDLPELFTNLMDVLPPVVLDEQCCPSFLALGAQLFSHHLAIEAACPEYESFYTDACITVVNGLGISTAFERSSGIDFMSIIPPEPVTEPVTDPVTDAVTDAVTDPATEEVNSAATTSVTLIMGVVALVSMM